VAAEEVPGVRGLRLTAGALSQAWELALRLAREGCRAQTTPVGAMLVDAGGAVIAAGRGRRYETTALAGQLAGTTIRARSASPLPRHGIFRPGHELSACRQSRIRCHDEHVTQRGHA
jgi:hypothetical protein